jgi:hypothetical protein
MTYLPEKVTFGRIKNLRCIDIWMKSIPNRMNCEWKGPKIRQFLVWSRRPVSIVKKKIWRTMVVRTGQRGDKARSFRALNVMIRMLFLILMNCWEILSKRVSCDLYFNRIIVASVLRTDLRWAKTEAETPVRKPL